MFPLPSTAGKKVLPLNGVTTVTGADQAAPARLRAIAMRPPGTASSSQTATASPARPSAIVAPSAFTVAAEIGAGSLPGRCVGVRDDQRAEGDGRDQGDRGGAESAHARKLAAGPRRIQRSAGGRSA